jgi:hypothetical protein
MSNAAVYVIDYDNTGAVPLLSAWLQTPDPQGMPSGALVKYQWQYLNGSTWNSIYKATAYAYEPGWSDPTSPVLIPADASFRVLIDYTDLQGNKYSINESTALVSAASTLAHRSLNAPLTWSGPAVQKSALTVQIDQTQSVVPLSAIDYQWQRWDGANDKWVDIFGARAATYTPAQIDVDAALRVEVRYSAQTGLSNVAWVESAGTVANVNDLPVSTLKINGVLKQGQTLTLSGSVTDADRPGETLDLSKLDVRWQMSNSAGGFDDLESTGSSLLLTQLHSGRSVRAVAAYSDPWQAEEVVVSIAGTVADTNDSPTGPGLRIEGDAVQGEVLGINRADIDDIDSPEGIPDSAWRWQWFAGGQPIAGATGPELVLTQAQVGKVITVQGTYTDAQGHSNTLNSVAPTAPVANLDDEPTGSLTIKLRDAQGQAVDGVWEQGKTLTLVDTVQDLDVIPTSGPGARQYQWYRNDEPIAGATGSTLLLAPALVGGQDINLQNFGDAVISARLTYTDGFGQPHTVLSVNDGRIRNLNDAPQGALAIKAFQDGNEQPAGSPLLEGQVLEAFPGTLSDADGLLPEFITWQWLTSAGPIQGATDPTLTLSAELIGQSVSVRASYIDGFEQAESVTRFMGTVANRPDPATGSIWVQVPQGQEIKQGVTLTAAKDLFDLDGLPADSAIQWTWVARRPNSQVSGAWIESPAGQGATLKLTQSHVDAEIQLRARFTDLRGGQESFVSDWLPAVGNVNDAPTSTLVVVGPTERPQEGQVLQLIGSVSDLDLPGLIVPTGLQIKWEASLNDGGFEPVGEGTALLVTNLLVDRTIQARVAYVDAWGHEEVLVVPGGTPSDVNTPPQGGLTVSGSPVIQGSELWVEYSGVTDEDSPAGIPPEAWSWQWRANGVDIPGATGEVLRLSQAQVGQTITVQGTYTDAQGHSNTLNSTTPTPIVANVNDEPTGTLTIKLTNESGQIVDGVWQQGKTLKLIDTVQDLDGIPVSGPGARQYQWLMNGEPIPGATSATLMLGPALVGGWDGNVDQLGDAVISARVSYNDSFSEPHTVWSANEGRVVNTNDGPQGALAFTGGLREGEVLEVFPGTLSDGDGLWHEFIRWQWRANGADIPGATGGGLELTTDLIGKLISVRASYDDGFGKTESLIQTAGTVLNRPDPAEGGIWVQVPDGQPIEQGVTLSARQDFFDRDGVPPPDAIQWSWFTRRPSASQPSGWSETPVGTGPSLTLTQAHVGAEIELRASFVDQRGGQEGPFFSGWLPGVGEVDDAAQVSVQIQGTVRHGEVLSLSGQLLDPDLPGGLPVQALRRQWEVSTAAGGVEPIPEQGGQTLWLDASLTGRMIRVRLEYTDFDGLDKAVYTSATPAVARGLSPAQEGQVYHWKQHTLIPGAEIALTDTQTGQTYESTSSQQGAYSLGELGVGRYQVAASLDRSSIASDQYAITSADAMAALKLSLGRNPNPDPDGPGPLQPLPVSPYQLLAADVNGDGKVTQADARAILAQAMRHEAGTAPDWVLVGEGWDLWDEWQGYGAGGFANTTAQTDLKQEDMLDLRWDGSAYVEAQTPESALTGGVYTGNWVAVLKGDVDGSWQAGGGGATLPAGYFDQLARDLAGIMHPSQFGLIPA